MSFASDGEQVPQAPPGFEGTPQFVLPKDRTDDNCIWRCKVCKLRHHSDYCVLCRGCWAPRFSENDDSGSDDSTTDGKGDKASQGGDDSTAETQATQHARLKNKLQGIVGKKKRLCLAKENLMLVTEQAPSDSLGLGIKAIQDEIELFEVAQTQVEEEMGLLDPMSYTETARAKQAKVQTLLAEKQEEKKRINARIKEFQDTLVPLEEEVEVLIKEERAATAAYQAALACLSNRAQKNQFDPVSVQPIADIAQVTAWINALHEGQPGEESKTSQPIVHTKWLHDGGQPGFAMTPTAWATTFINQLVQQMASRPSVTQVAQVQGTTTADLAAPPNGRKRPCAHPEEEANKHQGGAAPMTVDSEAAAGTLPREKEEKDGEDLGGAPPAVP